MDVVICWNEKGLFAEIEYVNMLISSLIYLFDVVSKEIYSSDIGSLLAHIFELGQHLNLSLTGEQTQTDGLSDSSVAIIDAYLFVTG